MTLTPVSSDRRRVGRGRRRHLRRSSTRPPRRSSARRPTPRRADAEAAAAAAAEALPGVVAHHAREHRGALLNRAADLLDAALRRARPAGAGRDRRHPAGHQDHAGAAGRPPASAATPRASSRTLIPLPPAVMPTTALAPGGIIGGVAHRAPVGVVACITSYNFPMTNMAGKIGPALAMGNTVVVKPAPQDPLAVIRMGEVFDEAGFPARRRQRRHRRQAPTPAEALVASPHVDMVELHRLHRRRSAASARSAGREHEAPAARARRQGRGVVFDDADLKTADRRHRQRVGVPLRPDLHRAHPGHRRSAASTTSWSPGSARRRGHLKVGDPLERDTVVGPVITERRTATASRATSRSAVDEGADVVAGGERPDIDTRLLRGADAARRRQATT